MVKLLVFLSLLTCVPARAEDPKSLALEIARGGPFAKHAENDLVAQGAAGAAILRELISEERSPPRKTRLLLVLARTGDPAAIEEVLRKPNEDTLRLEAALAKLGERAVPTLESLLGDEQAALGGRVVAARLLGKSGSPSARTALLAVLGKGPRELRKSAVLALGSRAPEELTRAVHDAVAARSTPKEADLWRVVGLLAKKAPPSPLAAAAIRERLPTSNDYELSYRLIQAAGALADEQAAFAAIMDFLSVSPDPAFEELAIKALAAKVPNHREWLARLLSFLRHPDPGVRAAVVEALAGYSDDERYIRDTAFLLTTDPWPLVRRQAALALGPHSSAHDALLRVLEHDSSLPVRTAAMYALALAKEPRIGRRLLDYISDNGDAELGEEAATLLGTLGDPALNPDAIAAFELVRAEASQDGSFVARAVALARVLPSLDKTLAEPALARALAESTVPSIQAAAADALAMICSETALAALERAAHSSEPMVVRAARRAQAECPSH